MRFPDRKIRRRARSRRRPGTAAAAAGRRGRCRTRRCSRRCPARGRAPRWPRSRDCAASPGGRGAGHAPDRRASGSPCVAGNQGRVAPSGSSCSGPPPRAESSGRFELLPQLDRRARRRRNPRPPWMIAARRRTRPVPTGRSRRARASGSPDATTEPTPGADSRHHGRRETDHSFPSSE